METCVLGNLKLEPQPGRDGMGIPEILKITSQKNFHNRGFLHELKKNLEKLEKIQKSACDFFFFANRVLVLGKEQYVLGT